MRMPRSSSFSVRDILDLPQMKTSVSSATPVSGGDDDNPTENGAANDGSTEIVSPQNSFSVANEALTTAPYNADSNNSRLQQSKFFQLNQSEKRIIN